MLPVQFLLIALSYAFLCLAQRCDTGPCANGCCNSNGWCGFGPNFCGDTCVSDCDRKSQCNPGFGAEWAERDKCPLNVCCSKDGYCGTTEDFCGDKKVTHKTCTKDHGNAVVVGYYEGWAKSRPCNIFWPEQIPIGVYTHINFAFAIIDPKTFKIAPSSQGDINLYKRLNLLKQKDPNLKVYIAVGGWAFNDPGPTATTFSDLAASVPRQKIFMESLLSFMSTYGFDGIDLDWEYPVAEDRSGRSVDFDNFPKFMKRLKETLSSAKKGLTITLPASYWYLQHFDLSSLVKSVDWFNIMSYDLHGTWDKGNKWTGASLNSHTNLTEIDLAMDLLWRNDVDPTKVVLGLAFYGRAFSMTSETCNTPGCAYESGAEKGKCSREVGILLNSEIDDMVKEKGIKPVLYKKEAAKVATWGNQWVAYDDEETLTMKSEYAQTLCLGGLMVWAISHDTKDAKYHKALAKAANRKISSLPMTDGSGNAFENLEVPQDQCKWTNCGDSCPSGWVHIKRSDERAKQDEYMYDESSCGPKGVNNFCCPASTSQPSCGWYTQKNGNCDSTCPKDMVEIGSYNKNCKKAGTYQSACCSADRKSMKLYTKGEWGKYPMCEETSSCPSGDSKKRSLLGSANAGSGQAICNAYYKGQVLPKDPPNERKFCYDDSNSKERFSDCVWYGGVGTMLPGAPTNWCLSGCPSNRVRIGMGYDKDCANFSYRALCCVPHMTDIIQVENPKLDEYRDALAEYIKSPRCEIQAPFSKRDSSSLVKREQKYPYDVTSHILLQLLTVSGGSSMTDLMEEAWNAAMGDRFSNLHFPSMREFTQKLHTWTTRGPIELTQQIMCNLNYWNSRASKKDSEKTLTCVNMSCDEEDCGKLEPERRSLGTFRRANDAHQRHSHHNRHRHGAQRGPTDGGLTAHSVLEKRGPARPYDVELVSPSGERASMVITLPQYHGLRDIEPDHPIKDEVFDYDDVDDCGNPRVGTYSLPEDEDVDPVNGRIFEMEHIVDGQLIREFMEDAAAGRLRSGATARAGPIAVSYFVTAQTEPILLGSSTLPGGASDTMYPELRYVYARVMECLGSIENKATFVALAKPIHSVKTNLMLGNRPMSVANLAKRTRSGTLADAEYTLDLIRGTIGSIRYLSYTDRPSVSSFLTTIINNAGAQWRLSQQVHNMNHPNDQTAIGDFWSEWVKDFYINFLLENARNFAREAIDALRETWTNSADFRAQEVLDALTNLDTEVQALSIDSSLWF
ncbi:hypothetical protein HBI70_096700 [Parastagonospora nodorum]|nr:hypothetical protein HBI79_161660 [Parastagonospora nodorum]KAH5277302.1 hypothetical protein HBI70_096700 [Parastagonospora nodorum]KAH5604382.1 hypothetical protein HBI45_115100 [Parastagonospora nodorum]KAH5624021.1 hypothetical protein HBI51_239350 [Parastagonospora nodorum]KAH6350413.1 hypothetical protein HBI37_051030 [Parastagonospora nodorum]